MAIPTLTTGEYYWDQPNQRFVFAGADGGKTVTAQLTWTPNQIICTELVVVPSSSPYTYIPQHGGMQQITKPNGNSSNSAIFSQDDGAAYYPSGTALTKVASNPATGQYACTTTDISVGGVGGFGQYTFAAGDAGKEVVITYEYLDPDYDAWAAQFGTGLAINTGAQGQAISAYMQSTHPDQAVGYTKTALVEGDAAFLGTSGVMPNYSYEVQGFGVVGGGVLDADPIVCAQLILTDPIIGIGFPSASIDQASWFNAASSADNWIKANALYISEAVENQTAAGSVIGRWLGAFNVAAVYSEGLLKLVAYGDEAVGGYTPTTTVVASLTDDNFIAEGKGPIKLTRTPWADAHNRVQVSYKSRLNSYNEDLVYEQDEASVERFGLRIAAPESLDFVPVWSIAAAVATMKLKRLQSVRNTYEFTVPVTFEYIEPGDLVALTDSRLGLSGTVVRVTKVENDMRTGLAIACEDWPGNGYAMPVANPKAVTPPQHPTQGTASAGGTSAVIVQADNAAPGQTGTRLYIWCTPADSPAWSGCAVFMSTDGSTYEQQGVVTQPGQVFSLQGALASVASNPVGSLGLTHDTNSSVTVAPATNGNQIVQTAGLAAWAAGTNYAAGAQVLYDGAPWGALVANSGELPTDASAYWQKVRSVTTAIAAPAPVTEAAASALSNLAAVIANNTSGQPTACEFLTFATVAAGAQPNTYTLSDFYRGALSSTITAFSAGAKLVLFSGASVAMDIPAGMAGKTLYFKFVAWNSGGASRQQIASAPVIQFVVAPSGSAGVLEGLGPPIGDVVRNNAGSGELVVAPRGGVTGNLPHVNHSTQTQAVINTSAQVVNTTLLDNDATNSIGEGHQRVIGGLTHSSNLASGRLLGGDSGLPADGGSGALGLGLTQTADAITALNVSILDVTPYMRWNDTQGGGRNFYRQSIGGVLQDVDGSASTMRYNVTASGLFGVARTAGSNIFEAQGNLMGVGAGVALKAFDSGTGGVEADWNSNGGTVGEYRAGTQRRWVTSIGHGFDRGAGTWEIESAGTVASVASGAAIVGDDTAGGGVEGIWQSASGIVGEYRAGTQRRWLTAVGHGLDRAPSTYEMEAAGQVQSIAAGGNNCFRTDDTSGSGIEALFYSAGPGEARINRAGADRYHINALGHGFDRAASTFLLEAAGAAMCIGTGVGFVADDTGTSGRAFLMQSDAGQFLVVDNTASAIRLYGDSSGNFGIGASTVAGFPLSVLGVGAFDTNSYMKASLGPHSTQLNKQGSVSPVAGTCVITFSATSSPAGVNVQVTAGDIYLPDGSTISVPAFNTTYTTWDAGFAIGYPTAPGSGSVSNIFQGNVVWNVALGQVQVQQLKHYIGQVNPTPAPFTGADLAACAADGLIPLQIGGYADLTTAAGGGTSGGGGSGGGGDICPVADQPIETQERGIVPAGSLQVGEHIRGERDKWVAVTARRDEAGDAVCLILTGLRSGTEMVRVSTGHRVMLHDGTWAAVSDIPLYTWLAGGAQLTHRAPIGRQPLAKLSCEGHIYRLGSTLSHNTCLI